MFKLTYLKRFHELDQIRHQPTFKTMRIHIDSEVVSHNYLEVESLYRKIEKEIASPLSTVYLDRTGDLVLSFDMSQRFKTLNIEERFNQAWVIANEACLNIFEKLPFLCWEIELIMDYADTKDKNKAKKMSDRPIVAKKLIDEDFFDREDVYGNDEE